MISIIIPTYNRKKFLKRCIFSLLNENIKGLEILIIDQGSTDGTLNALKKFPVKIFNFNMLKKPASARNYGLRLAHSKYIAFFDSDDELIKGGLRWRIKWLEKNPKEMAVIGNVSNFINHKGK